MGPFDPEPKPGKEPAHCDCKERSAAFKIAAKILRFIGKKEPHVKTKRNKKST